MSGDIGSRAAMTTGHVSPVSTRTGATTSGHPHLTAAQLRLVQREMSLISNVTNITNFSARISKPMFRKDIFYTGSIENLDEYKKKVIFSRTTRYPVVHIVHHLNRDL